MGIHEAEIDRKVSKTVMNGRFVILRHDHPQLHWDFMLEQAHSLRTWRLLAEPNSVDLIPAEALPDHRKHYLTYEGPVSADRGTVTQWDRGHYELLQDEEHHLIARLDGLRLKTTIHLRSDNLEANRWVFQLASSGAVEGADGR